jgi:hypothetical protein
MAVGKMLGREEYSLSCSQAKVRHCAQECVTSSVAFIIIPSFSTVNIGPECQVVHSYWILKGCDDGVLQFGLLSCWTLSIVQLYKNTTFQTLALSLSSGVGAGVLR